MTWIKFPIRRIAPVIVPAIAIVLSVLPLVRFGFAMGHDWPFELVRIAEFRFALLDGQLPPFWASDLYGGLGSPIFLFYPPLYLTVSSALVQITGSVLNAAVGALVVFTIVGALLMWKLLRQVCPGTPAAARVAVVLYVLHPYLLADKWVRNANAEFAALSILPGVLIGATAREPRRAFWWTAVSLTAVILAHNFVALIAAATALAVAAMVHREARAFVPVLLGLMAAVCLSAFFWVPAFVLLPLIQSNDLLIGKFDFHGQFPDLRALFSAGEFYSGGWLTLPLLAAMILAPLRAHDQRRVARAFALFAVGLLLLMTPFSTVIWENLPLLRYAQFPWRLLGPTAVLLAAGGGLALASIDRPRVRRAAEALIIAMVLIDAYPAFHRYVPFSSELKAQAQGVLTRDGIRTHNLRATVYDEYRPIARDTVGSNATDRAVVVNKWAFPVWSARVNGHVVAFAACRGGRVCIDVDGTAGQVALQLREPRVRQWAKAFSAMSVLGLVAAGRLVRPKNEAARP